MENNVLLLTMDNLLTFINNTKVVFSSYPTNTRAYHNFKLKYLLPYKTSNVMNKYLVEIIKECRDEGAACRPKNLGCAKSGLEGAAFCLDW